MLRYNQFNESLFDTLDNARMGDEANLIRMKKYAKELDSNIRNAAKQIASGRGDVAKLIEVIADNYKQLQLVKDKYDV